MQITIAQLNPMVGDIEGNLEKLRGVVETHGAATDLVVFPELYLVGYPARDLLESERFIQRVDRAITHIEKLSLKFPDTGILVGAPRRTGKEEGMGLHNAAVLIQNGRIVTQQAKSLLPTYDIFDEARHFDPADSVEVVFFHGIKLGLAICEDIWNGPGPFYRRLYPRDPLQHLVSQGAQLIITISASPFTLGKDELRYRLLQQHARKAHLPFVYVNQVGGNDELVFDGKSFCVDREGSPIVVLPGFQEDVHTVETELPGTPGSYPLQEATESIYQALVTGIRDYARKCGFQRVILGLSGGLDSAVTCCLAAAALGPEQVLALAMPSPYTSTSSTRDAQTLAANLGTELKEISISRTLAAYLRSLKPHFAGTEPDVTEENLQARIRGTLLMGFSNKFGHLVLATGNKSELAMGYCTLYGDMVGGLAPLADVPKTTVYDLAHYINRNGKVVPESIIRKPPSAELKPNQTDQDSLPPYEILDGILHYYVEKQLSQQEIVARGFDPETVRFVVQTVNRNEYKRRQAAPAIKVTSKAFGPGRRIPLAAKWE